ncbi:MAG TPA: V-type ATPase 116kDa subunit family protein [Conexivisphaerales archaeon]|nr:V-type ATPase 116kDa subunit family protein [Conexivisphaerales archaeon]
MAIKSLLKAVVVAPKSDSEKVFRELARFNFFDVVEEGSFRQRYELAEEIKKVRDQLSILADSLMLKEEPGVIEVLTKGYHVKKEKIVAEGWEDYVSQVKAEAKPILETAGNLNEEISAVSRRIEELESQKGLLEFVSTFHGDVGAISRITRFYAQLAIARTRDIKELKKSLPRTSLYSQVIGRRDSVVLVVGDRGEGQRIDRVLKSFEARPISLPKELSRDPIRAYDATVKDLDSLLKRREELDGELRKFKEDKGERILYLLEASRIASDVLSHASSNPYSRFIKLEGYIPSDRVEEFRKTFSDYIVMIEESEPKEGEEVPSLMENPRLADSFEAITLTQGSPNYNELDPTLIISVVFPIFYGIMFADAGQGVLMFLLGLALFKRGAGSIKKWGFTLMSFGVSATAVGLLVGEVFGFEIGEVPGIGPALSHVVLIHLKDASGQLPLSSVLLMMEIAIVIGIFHISSGLLLDILNSYREGHVLEVMIVKLPTLIFYVAGVLFGLAFIGAGFSFTELSSSAPTPLVGVPIRTVTGVVLPVILAMVLIIMLGRPVAKIAGKLHSEESLPIMLIEGLVEVLLKIVEFLANTVSYARLGILLIVHVILMGVVNMAWTSLGWAGLPILIFGNIGVMMLEGLIVYIQDLRLHLYEWFTKFYEGSGMPFRTMMPVPRRVEIVWKP